MAGQLGYETPGCHQLSIRPRKIPFPPHITFFDISAGASHALALRGTDKHFLVFFCVTCFPFTCIFSISTCAFFIFFFALALTRVVIPPYLEQDILMLLNGNYYPDISVSFRDSAYNLHSWLLKAVLPGCGTQKQVSQVLNKNSQHLFTNLEIQKNSEACIQ